MHSTRLILIATLIGGIVGYSVFKYESGLEFDSDSAEITLTSTTDQRGQVEETTTVTQSNSDLAQRIERALQEEVPGLRGRKISVTASTVTKTTQMSALQSAQSAQAKLERDNAEGRRRWAEVNQAFSDERITQEQYLEMLANTDPTNQKSLTPQERQQFKKLRQQYFENQRQIRETQQSRLSESELSAITRKLERELEQAK